MDLLEKFKAYLLSQKKSPSKVTVKNYAADIRHFIFWFQNQYHVTFEPTLVNAEHWKQFKEAKKNDLSYSSLERHLSSLRKFFSFLLTTNAIQNNPFDMKVIQIEHLDKDPWKVTDFKNSLKKDKVAKVTIKNYASDIHQFLSWIENKKNPDISDNKTILPFLNDYFLEQYKNELVSAKRFSQSSIKRKISSIKKYIGWNEKELSEALIETPRDCFVVPPRNDMKDEDKLKQASFHFLEGKTKQPYYSNKILDENKQKKIKSAKANTYSKIPPIRLFQKIFRFSNLCIDTFFVLPMVKGFEQTDYFLWVVKGKPVFSKKYFSYNFYNKYNQYKDYIKQEINSIVDAKKQVKQYFFRLLIPEKALAYRPAWYHRYHSYPVAHYFHFAILVIFMSAIGFNFYHTFFDPGNSRPVFASLPTAPPKILSFNGRLTDKNNNPITTRTNVRFAVYNSSVASGSALLWQEVDNVNPDTNGTISVPLGSKSYLDQDLFSKNTGLWLGATVEQADELRPRQELATTEYAAKAESLQGLLPITDNEAGTKNVVLALDSSGNLIMNGNDSHAFQATGGQFTLSGNTLLLATSPGSSTDVQIVPDGFGQLDIQKPIHNTSNNNNIASALGAVEVDDSFAILATTSGQSAFTINQNGYGPLISASSSGIARFTISQDGSIQSAGDVSIKGFVESNLTPFGNNLSLGSNVAQWDNLYAKNIFLDGSPLAQPWQENSTSIFPLNQNKNLLIGLTASTSANFQVIAATGDLLTKGNLILIGTASAIGTINNQTLLIGTPTTGAIRIKPDNADGIFVNNNGSVGIGTENLPDTNALLIQKNAVSSALVLADQLGTGDIFTASTSGVTKLVIGNNGDTRISGGGLCISSTSTCLDKSLSAGTIYASSTTVQSADVAENYISSNQLEPGDVIMPANDGNNLAITKTTTAYQQQVIGVVSTKPGVILNSDAQTDGTHPYIFPIALSGRVPVKVSIINGVVRTGDLLTASPISGVAMKATKAGPIIGKALEDYSNETTGKIMAYISISWANPSVSLADNGDLNISNQLFPNLNNDQENLLTAFINEIANGTQTTINNLYAEVIYAKNIISDSIVVNKKLVSPIADIAEVHSNVISPLSDTGKIALRLSDNTITIHNNTSASGAAVATFDNQGNASFSGQLSAASVETNDATISGVLHAGKIIASQIVGLPTGTTNVTNVTNVYNATPSSNIITNDNVGNGFKPFPTGNDNFVNIASFSGQLANVPTLDVNTATIEQGFVSLGPTSLADTSISGQLSIGSQFVFSDNSINVLGGDLSLQPLKQGGIAFAGRQVYIDTNGNITANGNATFNGILAANVIAPVPNHDLVFNLNNGNTSGQEANFNITNASNSAILHINQLGDIIASGEATINKLNFHLAQPALALSDNEIMTQGSAGVATVSANQTFVTIDNNLVTDKSLIYITPVGSALQNPYLLREVPQQSFTVGIDQTSPSPTTFNWLIIN